MATTEQHKALIRRYVQEIVSGGNLEAIPDFVAPDIVFRGPYAPEPIRGLEGFKELIARLHTAFSDFQVTEEDIVVEGDTVAVRWTASGTHAGEFMGTGPSGKPFQFTGTAFYRIADGKIVEGWAATNSLENLQESAATSPAAETTVQRVQYFYTEVSDKPGEGARILSMLKEAGINLLAFTGFPKGRRAQLDFIPADQGAFKAAARKAKLKLVGPKTGFLVRGADQIGALAEHMTKLANAGINVTASTAVAAGAERYGAILWVKPPDVRKAAKVLNASS